MLMSDPPFAPVSAANQQLPVGLSGEIISRSQIGQEFVWPKNDPRSQWQPQRTYTPSDDARIQRLGISPYFDMEAFLERTKTHDLPADEYQRWHASMRSTLNSRRMGFSYEQLAALFCADSGISLAHLDNSATLALAEYRALKAAAADTNWEKRDFPNAIRATIHAKKIPVLGLRLYPEYKLGSRLLPYHGIAVLVPGDNDGAERMEIRHEITVIGNPSYTRVVDEKGLTQFYEPSKPGV